MNDNFDEVMEQIQALENATDNRDLITRDLTLCFICEYSPIEFNYFCGNGVCDECFIGHNLALIENYKTKIYCKEIKLHCPGPCRCPININTIKHKFNEEINSIYDEILLKMYLAKNNDIIACPNSSCPNHGYVDRKRCYECLECTNCGTKWDEPDNSLIAKLKDNLKEFSSPSDIKSYVKKWFTTKYCNYCNSPIEKAEGCKHIICNRCEYGFCWNCTEDWDKHNEKACMGLYTNEWDSALRPDFLIVLLFSLGVLFLFKILVTFTIIIRLIIVLLKVIIFAIECIANIVIGVKKAEFIRSQGILKTLPLLIIYTLAQILFFKYMYRIFNPKIYLFIQVILMFISFVVTFVNMLCRK